MSTVNAIENGTLKHVPLPRTLEKLAMALNEDYAEVLRISGYPVSSDSGLGTNVPNAFGTASNRMSMGTYRSDNGSDGPILEWVMGQDGRHIEFVAVPVYGPAACGLPLSWTTEDAMDVIALPPFMMEGASGAIRVRGESMSAIGVMDGDTLIVKGLDGSARPPSGKLVIVCAEGSYVCKRYVSDGTEEYLEEHVAGQFPQRVTYTGEVQLIAQVLRLTREV